MKKWFVLLLTVAMLLTAIPCAMAEENVTLTFAFWDTNQEPGMKAIADAYMAEHPNVTIEVQVTPWGEYWTKLEAGAMGDSMPDVFWMHSNQFFKYVTADKLLSLDDLDYDYSPYPEGVTSLYTYEGSHYAIPKDYDTIALVYNKEIFDAAGEPYPDDTWDWAKFLEVAKKLTDPENGIYGFGAPNDRQSGYLNLIYQNGGFAFEDGKSGYDLPETKEAIQFWVDLMLKEGVSPSLESFVDMGVDDQMQAPTPATTCSTASLTCACCRRARPALPSTTAWAMPSPLPPSIPRSRRTLSPSAAPRKPTSCRPSARPPSRPMPAPSTTSPTCSATSTSPATPR